MILIPDDKQRAMYENDIAPNLKKGDAIAFGHGFNIHFGQVVPPDHVDVFMVAPKGPGHLVRSEYVAGGGVPCLIATSEGASEESFNLGLAYASAIGVSTALWHYLLMGMVSMTSVVSFESVGAILVVAFLIGPAAIAHLLTDRMPVMLALAALSGILAAGGGYLLASWLDASIAGAMTAVLGLEFALVFLFAPERGVLRKAT